MNEEFKPTIKVVHFKQVGKYYSSKTSFLRPEHYEMDGFELSRLIRQNDPSVYEYSDLMSGFSGSYIHIIEVDYGIKNDFCYFAISGAGFYS